MIDIRAMHRGSSLSTVFVFYNFDHPFSIGVVNILIVTRLSGLCIQDITVHSCDLMPSVASGRVLESAGL